MSQKKRPNTDGLNEPLIPVAKANVGVPGKEKVNSVQRFVESRAVEGRTWGAAGAVVGPSGRAAREEGNGQGQGLRRRQTGPCGCTVADRPRRTWICAEAQRVTGTERQQ